MGLVMLSNFKEISVWFRCMFGAVFKYQILCRVSHTEQCQIYICGHCQYFQPYTEMLFCGSLMQENIQNKWKSCYSETGGPWICEYPVGPTVLHSLNPALMTIVMWWILSYVYKHAARCTTGCTTSCTAGCMFVHTMQSVVQPVVQRAACLYTQCNWLYIWFMSLPTRY